MKITVPLLTTMRIRILLAIAVTLLGVFWFNGGVQKLARRTFPPSRPKDMPRNSVWIEADTDVFTWPHGWWFGCTSLPGAKTNHCVLRDRSGVVYEGEYVSCTTGKAIPADSLKLVAPQYPGLIWLVGSEPREGVAGLTSDGDILLPSSMIKSCESERYRFSIVFD